MRSDQQKEMSSNVENIFLAIRVGEVSYEISMTFMKIS